MTQYKAFNVGPLPVELINKTLDMYLEPGDLWVSKAAHRHIVEKHPDDYRFIIPALSKLISNPQYIGLDTRHKGNFNLICRHSNDEPVRVLVAIGVERTKYGTYNLKSAYRIKQKDIDSRRNKRTLLIVQAGM